VTLQPALLAEHYVALVNDGKLADLADLFADDGMVEPPNPAYARRIEGIEAIRAHYRNSVGRRKPHVRITHTYVDGNVCVVELVSSFDSGEPDEHIVDVFECDNAGKVRRLTAYRR
jgi:hypothetical protein